jgi:hypothetical protein
LAAAGAICCGVFILCGFDGVEVVGGLVGVGVVLVVEGDWWTMGTVTTLLAETLEMVVLLLRSLMVTGASSGGGCSLICFSFQCLFKLLRHLYVLPQREHANLVMLSSITLR